MAEPDWNPDTAGRSLAYSYEAAARMPVFDGYFPVATVVHTGTGCVGRMVSR